MFQAPPPSNAGTWGAMGQRQSLEDTLIELKLSARQMTAAARRAEKDEKKARNQIKTAIQKSNTEGARICGCAYRGVFASLSRATA